ncbi:MAG: ROK family protein [bacterium]|uniref:ROK family protein n=1 Tax=Gemmiger sp. TaxID=2049027 RepID=UPI003F0F401E|nr:ROK family protein [bacterium]
MLYLGVDLGGTNIKAALVDETGSLVREAAAPTGLPRSAQSICDDIASLCLALAGDRTVAGIGVGCPGMVDGGLVRYSNNLAWENFAMADYLTAKTGLPVKVGNDANVAALGEALVGCAKGAHSAVILTLGTGVGGGVVLDGRLLTGYSGTAAEPGHMVIADDLHAPMCTCGRRGCFESLASATALIRMTREAMDAHPDSLMHRLAGEGITGSTAFDAAAQGDDAGQAVVLQYVHNLAVGVANLINIFSPQVVGLSGGVANQGEALLAPLRHAVRAMVFGSKFQPRQTTITTCTLGYRAGVIGAAMLLR